MKLTINLITFRMVMPLNDPPFQTSTGDLEKTKAIFRYNANASKLTQQEYKDIYDVLNTASQYHCSLCIATTYRKMIEFQFQFYTTTEFISFVKQIDNFMKE